MKIAILTWTHTSNFGTALQAYALQAYLKKLGHEVVLIDYNGECREKLEIANSGSKGF